MRDYLTLSWARFSKDVQSHTLQISKILAHPAPRPGEVIRLDASPKTDGSDSNLEVIARFPGGLDFGRGLVDINFTMWPLFKCLNIDNILTVCEVGFFNILLVQPLTPATGCSCSYRKNSLFFTIPCYAWSEFSQMIVETSSHVSSYRLLSQLSGISLNCVAGMGLPFLQSIQEMQKYTLTILVHGLWDLRQKHVTALDRRLTFASAICKSQRFPSRIQFL